MKKNQVRVRKAKATPVVAPAQAPVSTSGAVPTPEKAPNINHPGIVGHLDVEKAIDAVDQSSRRLVALADLVSNRLSVLLEEQSPDSACLGAGYVDLVRDARADITSKVEALHEVNRLAKEPLAP